MSNIADLKDAIDPPGIDLCTPLTLDGPEGCCAVHEHMVTPYVLLCKGEEDYAVCLFTPAGTNGITYVLQDTAVEAERRWQLSKTNSSGWWSQ